MRKKLLPAATTSTPTSFELALQEANSKVGELREEVPSAGLPTRDVKNELERIGPLDARSKASIAIGVLGWMGLTILPLIIAISIVLVVVGVRPPTAHAPAGINDLDKLAPFLTLLLKEVVYPVGLGVLAYIFGTRARSSR